MPSVTSWKDGQSFKKIHYFKLNNLCSITLCHIPYRKINSSNNYKSRYVQTMLLRKGQIKLDKNITLKANSVCMVPFGTLHTIAHPMLTKTLKDQYYHLYFTNKETEALKSEVTCPKVHSTSYGES